jgi:hypothetical protein
VDSTVTPGLSWRDPSHPWLDGPDFGDFPCQPYRLSDQVLELPVGGAAWPPGAASFFAHPIAKGLTEALGKISGLRLGHRWLRPTTASVADMRAVMTQLRRQGCRIWVFMIHSSEIIPCWHHPSQEHVRSFLQRCLEAVRAAQELGALAATLNEAARFVEEADAAKEKTVVQPT